MITNNIEYIVLDSNNEIESVRVKKEFKIFQSNFSQIDDFNRDEIISKIEKDEKFEWKGENLVLSKTKEGDKKFSFTEVKTISKDKLIDGEYFIQDEDSLKPIQIKSPSKPWTFSCSPYWTRTSDPLINSQMF